MSALPRSPLPALQLGELQMSGVSSELEPGDTPKLRIERVEVRDLKLQTPRGLVRAARAVLSDVTVRLRTAPQAGGPLDAPESLSVGELRLEGASVEPHAMPPRAAGPHRSWRLDPLASLDGSLHADITDATWVFDADVTIPITRGRIDFNRATVEHVGPDSSMGLSRMGIYVDAPNGRTYLYLLSATHVPGASFERRGALLPSWTGDRGSIDIQPFVEGLISGIPLGAPATGARDMLARTRVRAELQLGNGVLGDDRDRVVLAGREQGKNRIELSSAPSGTGIVLRMPELSAGESHFQHFGRVVSTGALAATLSVQLKDLGEAPSVSASITELTLHDIVIGGARDAGAAPGS
jgi:hypothetical protein